MPLTDYHLHLRPDDVNARATDHFAPANVARYREAADAAGITELGVSEHVYRFTAALDVWQHPLWREFAIDDLDSYCDFIRSETDLRLGLEVDFIPGREDRIQNLIESYDLDYVVGSVHFVGDLAVDHDGYDIWGQGRSAPDIWRRYFELLGEAARTGLFDILAHPDLVKVWGGSRPLPEGDLRRYYDIAMDGIAESRIAVELSTAGLRKPVAELYPASPFLEMCLDAGCPIALSSDAHTPEHVGFEYDTAQEYLAAHDVSELAVFERRVRRLEPIGVIRTGIGYDVHRLAPARPLVIGGVQIDHELGLDGHSDADILAHAITDALLGAAALDDIGSHFPDTDPRWAGADSLTLLAQAAALVRAAGYEVVNVDSTVVIERPRIAPHRAAMRERLAAALGIEVAAVSVKGHARRGMGFVGRAEGAAAMAVATIQAT